MKNGSEKALRSFDRSLPMALLRAREAVMKKFLPSLRANNLSICHYLAIIISKIND